MVGRAGRGVLGSGYGDVHQATIRAPPVLDQGPIYVSLVLHYIQMSKRTSDE
jgi:hypothetical protein